MTSPAIRLAASWPPEASSGTSSRAASSVVISHVAAADGSIQSTAPKPGLDLWWSMSRIGTRPNNSAWSRSSGPMRSSSPQSPTTMRS